MRAPEKTKIADIIIPEGRRALNEEAVERMREGLRTIGLKTPISIRIAVSMVIDGEEILNVPVLVTGRHRLEAARREEWERIDTVEFEGTPEEAEMWEIAENLQRADLTALQHDVQVCRWIELQKLFQSETVSRGGRGNESGIRAASRKLGLEHSDAYRATKVASLSLDAQATAVETGLDDNRAVLLSAAKVKKEGGDDVVFLRQEHARREKEKARKEAERANRDTDRVIALTDAEQFADWLMARTDLNELPTLISWLEGTKAKDVIAALRRQAA